MAMRTWPDPGQTASGKTDLCSNLPHFEGRAPVFSVGDDEVAATAVGTVNPVSGRRLSENPRGPTRAADGGRHNPCCVIAGGHGL